MTSPVVELASVGRVFGPTPPVHALTDVSLRIDHGEFIAVVGPSGSGKSTLLSLLGLLDSPTSGTYTLDGTDTSTLSERDLCHTRASRLGFVFQSFHLLEHRSIEENVEIGEIYRRSERRQRRARCLDALDQVGLTHRIGFTPSTLSGGERQRVAIARALVREPTLLLCDEPTGNLDSATSETVLELLEALRSPDLTIVIITHDPTIAKRVDRQVQLLDGRVVS